MQIKANDTVRSDRRRRPRRRAARCCASTARPASWWSRASTACTSTSAAARRTRRAAGSRRKCRSSSRNVHAGLPGRAAGRADRRAACLADGSKERYCKKCGAGIGRDRPPKDKTAKPAKRSAQSGRRQKMSSQEEIRPKDRPPSPSARLGPPRRGCRSATKRRSCPRWPRSSAATNRLSLPRLEKIVVNMGVGSAIAEKKHLEEAVDALTQITGQKPLVTRSRKSIAGFQLREGMAIGCKVTLRGKRMYEFLDRLISLALPRVRDFRGLNPNGLRRPRQLQPGPDRAVGVPRAEPRQVHRAAGHEHHAGHQRPTATTRPASCCGGLGMPLRAA